MIFIRESAQELKKDLFLSPGNIHKILLYLPCYDFLNNKIISSIFLFLRLLLDKLRASAPSRIINTSAAAANLGEINFDNISLTGQYSPGTAFAQSKYAVLLYTLHLSERLKGTI